MDNTMHKAELFNLTNENLAICDREEFVEIEEQSIHMLNRPDQLWMGLANLPSRCNLAAIVHHLAGNQARARHYAERVVPAAKAYFFGDWRTKVPTDEKTIDPQWWRDKEGWTDNFRYAICWAAVAGDWDSVRELAAYPDHGRSMEEFGVEKKPARRALFIALAQFLRGEEVSNVAREMEKLTGAGWRGTVDLARTLDAIVAKDQTAAQMHLTNFFKAHHKRKKSKDITDTISIEGTILYYLAHHEGLDIRLDPKLYTYVIDLSSQG